MVLFVLIKILEEREPIVLFVAKVMASGFHVGFEQISGWLYERAKRQE